MTSYEYVWIRKSSYELIWVDMTLSELMWLYMSEYDMISVDVSLYESIWVYVSLDEKGKEKILRLRGFDDGRTLASTSIPVQHMQGGG